MHHNVSVVDVEPVDEAAVDKAPKGLYTKLRKTRTFEMDVMQKMTYWKAFKPCTSTYRFLYQHH